MQKKEGGGVEFSSSFFLIVGMWGGCIPGLSVFIIKCAGCKITEKFSVFGPLRTVSIPEKPSFPRKLSDFRQNSFFSVPVVPVVILGQPGNSVSAE